MNVKRPFGFFAAAILALTCAAAAHGQIVSVSVTVAPPMLPIYEQPPVPGSGFIWTPGYWAWAEGDYYWVPGTWVEAPRVGFLWTPGYWAAAGDGFAWNDGYWAAEVGFYGGINYGFGYVGVGYEGGRWDRGEFYYNRAVNNVTDTHITNVYNKTVVNNVTVNNVSYNGGKGGTAAHPTERQLAVVRQPHVAATPAQVQHRQVASSNKQLFASVNHGRPPVAATPKPGALSGPGVVPAHGGGVAQTSRGETSTRPESGSTARTTPSRPAESSRPNGRESDRMANRPPVYPQNAETAREHPGTPAQRDATRTERPAPAPARAPSQDMAARQRSAERPAPPREPSQSERPMTSTSDHPPMGERPAQPPRSTERAAPAPRPAQPESARTDRPAEPPRDERKDERRPPGGSL